MRWPRIPGNRVQTLHQEIVGVDRHRTVGIQVLAVTPRILGIPSGRTLFQVHLIEIDDHNHDHHKTSIERWVQGPAAVAVMVGEFMLRDRIAGRSERGQP